MSRAATGTSFWVEGRMADAAAFAPFQANYGHLSTMQVRGAAVQGWGRHVERLQAANAELFGTALPAARIAAELSAALAASAVDDATLRVSVAATGFAAVERGEPAPVALLVALSPPRAAPAAAQRVRSHPHPRPLPHLKHVATMPLLHARRLARIAGADDALLVDGAGRILEGSLWNVGFVDEGGGVVWPDAPALRGVTEGLLRAALAAAGIAQSTRPLRLSGCGGLRAAFACNSSGVWPLASIDGHAFAGDAALVERLGDLLAAVAWEPIRG